MSNGKSCTVVDEGWPRGRGAENRERFVNEDEGDNRRTHGSI
jgi:hypothetical protein